MLLLERIGLILPSKAISTGNEIKKMKLDRLE
jgi:hypothetical protein